MPVVFLLEKCARSLRSTPAATTGGCAGSEPVGQNGGFLSHQRFQGSTTGAKAGTEAQESAGNWHRWVSRPALHLSERSWPNSSSAE